MSKQIPASKVRGSASPEDKERLVHLKSLYTGGEGRWGHKMKEDAILTSVDVRRQTHGPRNEAVVEFEIVVQEYMCNAWDMAHGGMISTLLDFTTSLAIPVILRDEEWLGSGLTLSLSVNLLSPALLGENLKVVATTKAGGKRTATVHGELWSPRGLVATATHVKMVPTQGPASMLSKDKNKDKKNA